MPTSHNILAICLFSLTACTCQASSALRSDVLIAEEDTYCCGMLPPQSLASAAVPLFHLHILTPIFLYGQKYNRMTTTTRSITAQADYDQINIIQNHPELQYGKVHGVDNVALCTSDRLKPTTQASQVRWFAPSGFTSKVICSFTKRLALTLCLFRHITEAPTSDLMASSASVLEKATWWGSFQAQHKTNQT